jgi:hypothetical protein
MAMQDELNQFKRNEVWDLVPLPCDHKDELESHEYLNHVYKLKRALYGLKQTPRVWYEKLIKFLINQGYSRG